MALKTSCGKKIIYAYSTYLSFAGASSDTNIFQPIFYDFLINKSIFVEVAAWALHA